MIKVNELVEAKVDDLAHDGCGVAKVDGRVYFINGVLPNELIRFQPRKKRKGKFEGILDAVLQESEQRVTPECKYFGVCGGCVLQHTNAQTQLEYKEKILFDSLERIGKVTAENIIPPIQSEIWKYRRKARLGVKFVPGKGGILVGFRERSSSFLTSLQSCKTLDKRISELLPGLHHLFSQLSNNHRMPQVEVAAGDDKIGLVVRHLKPLGKADISRLTAFAREFDLHMYSQSGGPNTVTPLWPAYPELLSYQLPEFGLTLEFGPADFTQVNTEVNQMMVSQAMRYLQLNSTDHVLDLFCGLGNFTLAIARSGAEVVGVEGDQSLVNRGTDNANLNNILNARFQTFDLHCDVTDQLSNGQQFNKVLLDPPRSGALQVVSQLVPKVNPDVLVYISCNPATLARDADVMVNTLGYSLTDAGAIDMFPHTAHVESMAVFRRN